MIINSIKFRPYGGFIDKEVCFRKGVNLILGSNESGKTTITNGIKNLFYGIYPATLENNNYVSWDKNELFLEGEIYENGKKYLVNRYLTSYGAKGEFYFEDDIKKINNKNIPLVSNISRKIYEDLYFLDYLKLLPVKSNTWKAVEDEIIFSYDDSNIKNPEKVMEEIDEELFSIWRFNNRGKFKIKEIEEKINSLKEKKFNLNKKYESIKSEVFNLKILEEKIKNNNKKLESKIKLKSKAEKLLPVSDIIDKIEKLKKGYENYEGYLSIFPDILNKIEETKNKIKYLEKRKTELIEEKEKKELKFLPLTNLEKKIEKSFAIISEKLSEYEDYKDMKNEFKKRKNNYEENKKDFDILFIEIFDKQPSQELLEYFNDLELKSFFANRISKKEIIIFFVFLIIGYYFYLDEKIFFSILSFSLIIGIILKYLLYNKKMLTENKKLVLKKDDFFQLKKLFKMSFLLEEDRLLINGEENKLKGEKNELGNFFYEFNPIKNLDFNVKVIKEHFGQAKNKIESNKKYNYQIESIENSIRKINIEIQELIEKNKFFKKSFRALGYSDFNENKKCYIKNKKIEKKIINLEEELLDIDSNGELSKEYKENNCIYNKAFLNKIRLEIEDLNEILYEDKLEIIRLKNILDNNSIEEDLNDINSQLKIFKDEKKKYHEKKKKLLYMKNILLKSNKLFKEDNQPGIMKKASKYFTEFTNGKYDKIYMDDNEKKIYIKVKGKSYPLERNFSQGTIDQLYFAFKLSIIESYEDNIHLPLILDEVFSNWDDQRLKSFLFSIGKISNNRQIIILTCKNRVKRLLDSINYENYNLIEIGEIL